MNPEEDLSQSTLLANSGNSMARGGMNKDSDKCINILVMGERKFLIMAMSNPSPEEVGIGNIPFSHQQVAMIVHEFFVKFP